jgi:hypothetical protein
MDKILKFDNIFNLINVLIMGGVDTTLNTIDSTLKTIDLSTLTELVDSYRLEIVPRKYDSIVTIIIREPFSNEVQTLTTTANVYKSLLNIDLTGFIPVNDNKYEFIIFNQLGDIIWFGGVLYSTKNIQNYQLNNSDENNLKF